MAQPRLLVFDLDGTLVDSQIDLANSVNATLEHFGKPSLPAKTIANYIGGGAATLVRKALAHVHLLNEEADPHDEEFVQKALAWFIDYYKVHKLDFTYVYPGVLETLADMQQRHPALLMAVLTNKPVAPSRAICRHFGLDRFFFQNYGGNSFTTKKPDPEALLTLIREANVLSSSGPTIYAEDTVMIGDSHVDIETAHAAGTRSLGCNYGLSPETLVAARPDRLVTSPWEWRRALDL